MQRGRFIVVDGCDFTGKSTQIQKIAAYLRSHNIKHITTREPGGTNLGEQLREILMQSGKELHQNTEFLLFLASRCEHVHNKIIPMLEQGVSIICDRYLASTFVYQGILKSISQKAIFMTHKLIINNFLPDVTFLFDMEPEIILQRMEAVTFRGLNSYDSQQIDEITKIRNGFLEYSKIHECTIVNANQNQDKVFEIISKKLDSIFTQE